MKRVLAILLAFAVPMALFSYLVGGPAMVPLALVITAAFVVPGALLARPRRRRR
jgi:hypothetical protein